MLPRITGPGRPFDLRNETVLLVGVTSGIGEAMAHQLAGGISHAGCKLPA
jgi:NAD(P)-dependent dehydrogenase (short-subunit alcohol dehydrogenase family)